MKKIGKFLLAIVLIVYIPVVIFLTVCLLNYNDYNITQFGDYSLIIIDGEEVGEFTKGDLVIVEKNDNSDIAVNDYIFFYDTTSEDNTVRYAQVKAKEEITEDETTFTLDGDFKLSSEFVIGEAYADDAYESVGGILAFLQSRWGFLFFVILPVLLLFIYQIYMFVTEVKSSKKE